MKIIEMNHLKGACEKCAEPILKEEILCDACERALAVLNPTEHQKYFIQTVTNHHLAERNP